VIAERCPARVDRDHVTGYACLGRRRTRGFATQRRVLPRDRVDGDDVNRLRVEAGAPCVIVDAGDKPLGIGYVNPNSLICARLVHRGIAHALDRSLIVHKLNVALALRTHLYTEPYYRLVFGEADGLPGLTVDRYGDVLVAQTTTAGMERMKDDVAAAVVKVKGRIAIVLSCPPGSTPESGTSHLWCKRKIAECSDICACKVVMLARNGWNASSVMFDKHFQAFTLLFGVKATPGRFPASARRSPGLLPASFRPLPGLFPA